MPDFDRIVTHNDFDGVVSAAVVSRAMGVDRFLFTGPRVITGSKLVITARDIVCDLPYPLECGLWFDHHEGNLEDVRLRGIDPSGIPGRFEPRDSCARVVYDHFSPAGGLPAFYAATVDEADVLDGFHFSSMEDWRRETPGKVVDGAIQGLEGHPRDRDGFMCSVVRLLRDFPVEEVARKDEIQQSYRRYLQQEERMLQTIRQQARFMAGDPVNEVVVIDFTSFNRPPRMVKKLAFLLFPEAQAVVEVRNPMRGKVKSKDLSISMSLGICLSNVEHRRNVGEIMRELNLGDGHAGAGAGLINCTSKAEMLSEKERILGDIMKIWKTQA